MITRGDILVGLAREYFRDQHTPKLQIMVDEVEKVFNIHPNDFLSVIFSLITMIGRDNPEFQVTMIETWDISEDKE